MSKKTNGAVVKVIVKLIHIVVDLMINLDD